MVVEKRAKGEARASRFYPAYDVKPKAKSALVAKPPKLRSSLTPGTVLIMLAGRFRGKRVVMLKVLESGLLLVTGPFEVNGVPLRRVNAAYVIGTSTKIDVSGVELPETVCDAYFKRPKEEKKKKTADEFFAGDDEHEGPSDERKADQAKVDAALMTKIDEVPMLKAYLGALFTLTKGMKPHEMKF